MQRDVVFLSHANPEDNQFTKWLATKVSQQGYAVFCDLMHFKGGEDFWRDAESAIRRRTAKFVYVLSRTSNIKQGPLNELRVAANVARDHNLNDFIIPIGIDDLPARDANIEIARLNIISAEQNWAAAMRMLLEKLTKDAVPRTSGHNIEASIPQWRDSIELSSELIDAPDLYMSNWFPIVKTPSKLFVHRISGFGDLRKAANQLPWAAKVVKWNICSFADATGISTHLPSGFNVTNSTEISESEFGSNTMYVQNSYVNTRQLKAELYRLAFEQYCSLQGLGTYRMANRARCLYFPRGLLNGDKVHFSYLEGRSKWKNLAGYRSRMHSDGKRFRRYWHFGVQARPLFEPMPVFALTPHVVFSSDGKQVWTSTKKLHQARRSQCKDWWNNDWRDRLIGTMAWLAVDDLVSIAVSPASSLGVSAIPVRFDSPVSFNDPAAMLTSATTDTIETE